MKTLTVFTLTYNRAYCLDKCYKSLLRQTCDDFEWYVIDDGSTDNTRELVEVWQKECTKFKINRIPPLSTRDVVCLIRAFHSTEKSRCRAL